MYPSGNVWIPKHVRDRRSEIRRQWAGGRHPVGGKLARSADAAATEEDSGAQNGISAHDLLAQMIASA
jgi:hypothetical protein